MDYYFDNRYIIFKKKQRQMNNSNLYRCQWITPETMPKNASSLIWRWKDCTDRSALDTDAQFVENGVWLGEWDEGRDANRDVHYEYSNFEYYKELEPLPTETKEVKESAEQVIELSKIIYSYATNHYAVKTKSGLWKLGYTNDNEKMHGPGEYCIIPDCIIQLALQYQSVSELEKNIYREQGWEECENTVLQQCGEIHQYPEQRIEQIKKKWLSSFPPKKP